MFFEKHLLHQSLKSAHSTKFETLKVARFSFANEMQLSLRQLCKNQLSLEYF